jgi:DNA-binding transcriptional regulator YiaG
MDKQLFAELVESMQRHNEIMAGTRKPARVTKVNAQSIKVLRANAGLTQEKFAALIQVDLTTAPSDKPFEVDGHRAERH